MGKVGKEEGEITITRGACYGMRFDADDDGR